MDDKEVFVPVEKPVLTADEINAAQIAAAKAAGKEYQGKV
jgi:hypothetical protein